MSEGAHQGASVTDRAPVVATRRFPLLLRASRRSTYLHRQGRRVARGVRPWSSLVSKVPCFADTAGYASDQCCLVVVVVGQGFQELPWMSACAPLRWNVTSTTLSVSWSG